MPAIVAIQRLTLDGVMQAPGRADEDRRGGFEHGGWAQVYNDPVLMQVMGAGLAEGGPLLFGRRTYEDFAAVWPSRQGNPFTEVLERSTKYVASRTLREPLAWRNSVLLAGEAADTVARLKAQPGKDLAVLGCGELMQTLMRCGLVDRYVLLIHPLVLGRGRRLFDEGGQRAALRLVDCVPTSTGVLIATYQPA